MREPDYCVTFVERRDSFNPSAGEEFETDEITVTIRFNDGELTVGEYEFESDPLFGSPTTAEGHVLFDTRTSLLAFTKKWDTPKDGTIVRALSKAFPVDLQAPSVLPASQHLLYRQQGTSAYSVTFKSDQADYERGSRSGPSVRPEERAKEELMFEQETTRYDDEPVAGIERIDAIVDECIEDGMFVGSAPIKLTEDQRAWYSDPLRFTDVDVDFAHDGGFNVLFGYARVLIEQ